jgi:predicted aspartyl protease
MARHIFVLCLLVAFLAAMASGQTTPYEYVVPVKVFRGYVIVLQGAVGPLTERNLVIDTGAYPSVIDRKLAKTLGLAGEKGELRVLNHTLKAQSMLLPSLRVGPIEAQNTRVVSEDLGGLSQELGLRVDALVGLDVLAGHSFRIDYDSHAMVFGPVETLSASAPIRFLSGMACVPIRLDGRSQVLLLDTGAANTVLFSSRATWLTAKNGHFLESTNLGGTTDMRSVKLTDLMLGEKSLGAQEIYLSNAHNMDPYPFDGMFSPGALQLHEIAFDFERQLFSWETSPVGRKPETAKQISTPLTNEMIFGAKGGPTLPGAPGFTPHAILPPQLR